MKELENTELMILRGKLSTLRREDREQRRAFAERCAVISNCALSANRFANDVDAKAALVLIQTIPNEIDAAKSLLTSIQELAVQMDGLRDAWEG